jgi:hypothetical protein
MIGFLFRSRTEKMVRDLEFTMTEMESAALRGDLRSLHSHTRKQIEILNWLTINGDWSEEKVFDFLKARGKVRSLVDPEVERLLGLRVPEAERQLASSASDPRRPVLPSLA